MIFQEQEELLLEEIIHTCQQAIENILLESVDKENKIDIKHARTSIDNLWFQTILVHNPNLDISSVKQVRSLFDNIISCLDEYEVNAEACKDKQVADDNDGQEFSLFDSHTSLHE